MIDILYEIMGQPPAGYEFLIYIFCFILILAGLYVVYNAVCAVVDLFR